MSTALAKVPSPVKVLCLARPPGEVTVLSCLPWEKENWLRESNDLRKVTQLVSYVAGIQTPRVNWLLVQGSFLFAIKDQEGPSGYAKLVSPQ